MTDKLAETLPEVEILVTVDEKVLKKLDDMEKKLKRPRSTIIRAIILKVLS